MKYELQEMLLSFPKSTRAALINFFDDISRADYDVVIFMARKALRLYDCALAFGAKPCSSPVYSQHIIEQFEHSFAGKRILLIDDTLILGSTLARTKGKLLNLGAKSVDIYAFARDTGWSTPTIVEPERVYCELTSDEMLTFCAAEVRLFSHLAVPYLSDFVMTTRGRFDGADLDVLLSSFGWHSTVIASTSNRFGVGKAVTLIPSNQTIRKISVKYGFSLAEICEIAKIRTFCFSRDGGQYHCKFVPMATFRPVSVRELKDKFSQVFDHPTLARFQILREMHSPKDHLRFFQYVVGLLLFREFEADVCRGLRRKRLPNIDWREISRHVSPTMCEQLQLLNSSKFSDRQYHKLIQSLYLEPLTAISRNVASNLSEKAMSEHNSASTQHDGGRVSTSDFFVGLIDEFIKFYRRIELPARQEIIEAHKDGEVDYDKLEKVDRLKTGVSWSYLINQIMSIHTTWQNRQFFSLYLDRLVDKGIAVPSICVEDGKIFRVYRHGETVLFGEQEYALSYELFDSFLKSSGRDRIPKQDAEKILAFYIRAATAEGLLEEVIYPEPSNDAVRIGFHRHGAVAYVDPYREGNFAGPIEHWLTKRLQTKKVISKAQGGYKLGRKPDAAISDRDSAVAFAKQIGLLLGKLRHQTSPMMSARELAVLVSAGDVVDGLAAVSAELRIFESSYFKLLDSVVQRLDWNDLDSIAALLGELVDSPGKQVMNSAKMKILAVYGDEHSAISDRINQQLEDDHMYQTVWTSSYSHSKSSSSKRSRVGLRETLDKAAMLISDLLVLTSLAELSLSKFLADSGGLEKHSRRNVLSRSIVELFGDYAERFSAQSRISKVYGRLKRLAGDPESEIDHVRGLELAVSELRDRRDEIRILAEEAEQRSFTIGRHERRTDFHTSIWYDVISSRGRHLEQGSAEHKLHLNSVRAFIDDVGNHVRNLQMHQRDKGFIIQTRRVAKDGDDEKEVFFGGERHRLAAYEFVEKIAKFAEIRGVGIRMILVPGDVHDSPAYSVKGSSRIDGRQFLEAFSELKDYAEDRSKNGLEHCSKANSLLFLVGSLHSNRQLANKLACEIIVEQEFVPIKPGNFGERQVPVAILRTTFAP